MTIIYHDEDGDLQNLGGKTIGVIGYGNLGRPIALNLRDSGVNVVVSVRTEDSTTIASDDGFLVLPIDVLVRQTDILFMLLPDEVMAQVYLDKVSPNLKQGNTLIFSSAYNVAFGYIEAPPFVDVGLV